MAVKQTTYLDRFIDPFADLLPREALERVVRFRFDEATQARAAELAEKANEGLLTEEERTEYAEYIEAVDLIGIVQATARSALARRSA
ncbi:MAG TPA: hypothetical protein VH475_15295 [Tepidisphaeraceae bacterium]